MNVFRWFFIMVFVSLVMACTNNAPIKVPPPGHPNRGLCAWCAELPKTCNLPDDCEVCR